MNKIGNKISQNQKQEVYDRLLSNKMKEGKLPIKNTDYSLRNMEVFTMLLFIFTLLHLLARS